MKILVTGSNGFVGRNLVWNLREIRDGKNQTRPELNITEIYGYDMGSSEAELENACARADFVFHLAGVNRPKNPSEFDEQTDCGHHLGREPRLLGARPPLPHRRTYGACADAAGDVPVTYADTGKLERDYGFKPKTGLRSGLRAFAEWYKEYYKV